MNIFDVFHDQFRLHKSNFSSAKRPFPVHESYSFSISSIAARTSASEGTPLATVKYKTTVMVMCSAGLRTGVFFVSPFHVSTSLPRLTRAAFALPICLTVFFLFFLIDRNFPLPPKPFLGADSDSTPSSMLSYDIIHSSISSSNSIHAFLPPSSSPPSSMLSYDIIHSSISSAVMQSFEATHFILQSSCFNGICTVIRTLKRVPPM